MQLTPNTLCSCNSGLLEFWKLFCVYTDLALANLHSCVNNNNKHFCNIRYFNNQSNDFLFFLAKQRLAVWVVNGDQWSQVSSLIDLLKKLWLLVSEYIEDIVLVTPK